MAFKLIFRGKLRKIAVKTYIKPYFMTQWVIYSHGRFYQQVKAATIAYVKQTIYKYQSFWKFRYRWHLAHDAWKKPSGNFWLLPNRKVDDVIIVKVAELQRSGNNKFEGGSFSTNQVLVLEMWIWEGNKYFYTNFSSRCPSALDNKEVKARIALWVKVLGPVIIVHI